MTSALPALPGDAGHLCKIHPRPKLLHKKNCSPAHIGRDSAKARDGMCGHSSPGPFRCTYTTTSPESSSFRKRGPSPLVALHSFPRPSKLLFAPPVPLFTRPLQSPNSFLLRRRQRKTLAYLTKKTWTPFLSN